MYLNRKIYIGGNYEHNKVAGTIYITQDGVPINVDLKKVTYIIEQVAYWRKANQIHAWFVKNVQDGIDKCQESYVTIDQLRRLLRDVNDVLENRDLAMEILPTQSGFFFGGTGIDAYYFEDLEYTRKVLEEIISNDQSYDYYYQSSW